MVQIIRLALYDKEKEQFELYIPHGSDNTFFKRPVPLWPSDLYIPHGSDNTETEEIKKAVSVDFISHMVQIIHAEEIARVELPPSFISHMVQIILLINFLCTASCNSLYPTWFR